MKFAVTFLTGAALARHAVITTNFGPPRRINPVPGECTSLFRFPVVRGITTPDIGLKFYTGPECDGKQVATTIGEKFKVTGEIRYIQSVKVVYPHELTDAEAHYYIF
jgi:hypothetical protein